MTTLHHHIRIDAPAQTVWAVLTDLEEVANYNRTVRSARYLTPARTGPGSARECQLDSGFVKERVTSVDEGRSISMELYESNWPLEFMRWTTEIESSGRSATLMKQTTEYAPGNGIVGRIMNRLIMKRKFDRILTEVISDLKHYVESKSVTEDAE